MNFYYSFIFPEESFNDESPGGCRVVDPWRLVFCWGLTVVVVPTPPSLLGYFSTFSLSSSIYPGTSVWVCNSMAF